MSKKVTRLFTQFQPEHYKLNFSIADDKQTFSGFVEITGKKVGRPTKRITLHQKDLKLSDIELVAVTKEKQTQIPIARTVQHASYDEVRIHTIEQLLPGAYIVRIRFNGVITRNMEGIYPCFYKDADEEKRLIATQFESHYAREAFPCVDEPEAKATFDISLEHAKDEVALSNTPVSSAKTTNARTTTSFETTPKMSTYLVAFVVGELSYKEATSKNNITIRTYATKEQVTHSAFALDVAVKCMDFYEDYYDIPFPLQKCDFVALPDFASGAMENWGLITFREQTLLVDEQTSLNTKQYVALVVAHELTHQWFGNLVTMRWWTDLWLNEGFASWMEYLAIDHYFPEWHMWTQFSVDEQQLALKLDALEHTHPIEVTIKHPDEIRTIFDAISYQKGASVIHMLHDFLGADTFRDGLRHYLKTHSYKNTHTIDLWQALEDVSNKPVKQFMSAWTSQAGFPILQVEQKADHLKITQCRFVTNPTSKARNDTTLWPAPLLTPGLNQATAAKRVTNVPLQEQAPILLNVGQTGFYRIEYSSEMQQRQLSALAAGEIQPIDRMGLLSDGIEGTKAGYQSVTEYLKLLKLYANEDSLPVWEIIASSIGSIRSTLSVDDTSDELREAMKPFVRELVSVQLQRLGWEEKPRENHLDTLLRPIILGLAAGADEPAVVKESLRLFDSLNGDNAINPNIRGIVYSTAVRKRGAAVFEILLSMYQNTQSSDEKLSITAAMTSFEDISQHEKMLKLIKTDTIRLQDVSYWIAYGFMNRHGRQATWQWLKENWQWLKENLGTDLSFSRMPIYAARTFADNELLDDYVKFFADKLDPSIQRSYDQGLEIAQTAVAWRKRDAQDALAWFKS